MDSVIFKKDIAFADDSNNPVFKKNNAYEILNEDKEFIYVGYKPNSNECSQIPKTDEGILFEYK
ncbi:hypothetical protein ASG46_06090 [Bacillus sp. Leaf49]|uniref:hypothetical protein n=1 Tax=Bacillus sp. Leaf49 TaxID=1736222 RepID=UPI000700BDE9|nr:hypothetical protein [Bacillus sp. Leaf49]KQU12106.1 hypothetical protein ASG46_06090 [Bacillus sp. Leaf49]